MAVLHAVHAGELPEDRAKLYDQSVDLLLGAWQKRRLVKDTAGRTRAEPGMMQVLEVKGNLGQVRKAMEKLAFQVHKRQYDSGAKPGAATDIRKGEVLDAFDELLNQSELKSRQLLDYLDQQAGLLIARADGGPYMFPHRSFQEFLAACYLARKPGYKELLQLLDTDPLWWREVWLLAVGYLCSDREGLAAEIVHKLMPRAMEKCKAPTDIHWRKAILAGEALLEQKVPAKRDEDDAYLEEWEKNRDWLAALVQGGELDPRERAEAGDILARLGHDPRPGVGLDADGLPDIAWVDIPAGTFMMGSDEGRDNERPVHEVEVSAFRIARYPITNAQYAAFIQDAGHKEPSMWDEFHRYGNRPVVNVTWYDAVAFCRWLSERRGENIRLPTEAEWEYAARGTGSRRYAWGDEDWEPERANIGGSGIGHASAVGMYPQGVTPQDLFDMTGNVWEWVQDRYGKYSAASQCNPTGPDSGSRRVFRGGAWDYGAQNARAAYRFEYGPVWTSRNLGFRCARVQK